MKFVPAFAIFVLGVGITATAFGQSDVGLPTNSYSTRSTGLGTNSKNSGGVAPSATPDESKTDENDDTLYRGRTSESEVPILLDDGPLHFKTRPKEKIQEVNSLKNLQSSGSDPKFQGSLLNSNVSSIEKVSEKAKETRDLTEERDPRFRTKRLTFTADNNDEPKKAQSDSSPSPTPSPTTSPAAKNSGGSKQ